MGQRLTADDLGQTGEDLFSRLCSMSGLVCNKSLRDRAGWDFVVDVPADNVRSESLDQRPARACVVQLKSTSNSNPVRLSLSAIEPVAKDPRPAFVIVFRLTPEGREVAGYLIHLIGPVLERILRRLRQAEATGRLDINKASISLDYTALGVRFDLSAEGLRQAIDRGFMPNMGDYFLEKRRQLDNLGYDDGRLQAEATIWVESPEHLSRVLVGLEPMKPVALRAFDVRFGLAIPYNGSAFDDVEELRIEPPRVGPCRVFVRGAPLTPSAAFTAEAFAGQPVPSNDRIWLLIRHPDFTLSFVGNAVRFETEGDFYGRRRTLAEWGPLARALAYLATGKGEMSFQFEGKIRSRLSLPMHEPLNGPDTEMLPRLARFLDEWSQLVEMAGTLASEAFSLEDLWAERGVQMAADMMANPTSSTHFAFDLQSFEGGPELIEALYFNSCRLGGAAVSYSVKITLARFDDEYRSQSFTPLDARPEVEDLQAYGEEQALAAGIQVLVHPDNIVEVSPAAVDDEGQ